MPINRIAYEELKVKVVGKKLCNLVPLDRAFCAPLLFPYLAMHFVLSRYWLLQEKPGMTRMYNRDLQPPSCSPVEEVDFADGAGFSEGEANKTS